MKEQYINLTPRVPPVENWQYPVWPARLAVGVQNWRAAPRAATSSPTDSSALSQFCVVFLFLTRDSLCNYHEKRLSTEKETIDCPLAAPTLSKNQGSSCWLSLTAHRLGRPPVFKRTSDSKRLCRCVVVKLSKCPLMCTIIWLAK